jgi:hypothetical protein
MKQRKVYYSRKAGRIVAEGKRNNKTIYLFVIPSIPKLLESSLFSEEKKAVIMGKYQSLDTIQEKLPKQPEKLRAIKIARTQEVDDKLDDFNPDELIEEIKEVSK